MTYPDRNDSHPADVSTQEDKTFDKTMIWIGGACAALVIALAIAWGMSSDTGTVASTPPAATTGSAPASR